jgi:hypothetical protein
VREGIGRWADSIGAKIVSGSPIPNDSGTNIDWWCRKE